MRTTHSSLATLGLLLVGLVGLAVPTSAQTPFSFSDITGGSLSSGPAPGGITFYQTQSTFVPPTQVGQGLLGAISFIGRDSLSFFNTFQSSLPSPVLIESSGAGGAVTGDLFGFLTSGSLNSGGTFTGTANFTSGTGVFGGYTGTGISVQYTGITVSSQPGGSGSYSKGTYSGTLNTPAAVPEPSSLALTVLSGLGLAAVLARRRVRPGA